MQLDPLKLYYLASVYTNYPAGIWPAYKEAARIAGGLVARGFNIYSPIAHSHPLAVYGGIDPLDHAFWMQADAKLITFCNGLIVACMDGWKESKGIEIEIRVFRAAGKPVFYCDPTTLEIVA